MSVPAASSSITQDLRASRGVRSTRRSAPERKCVLAGRPEQRRRRRAAAARGWAAREGARLLIETPVRHASDSLCSCEVA